VKNLLAQVPIGPNLTDNTGGNSIGTRYNSFGPLINAVLKNSLTIAGIIFLALLIFGGISMIASAGSSDSKKAAQSKQTITSAVIGLIIVFSAYFIIQIITVITGVEILNSGL
jgi:uncharacterized membrane protein